MSTFIERENYAVEFEEPELYVDNKTRGRSGHMTHAMAEFAPGCFIDFNSNCSPVRWSGHSTYGWVEYRISKDAQEESKKEPLVPVVCFLDIYHNGNWLKNGSFVAKRIKTMYNPVKEQNRKGV